MSIGLRRGTGALVAAGALALWIVLSGGDGQARRESRPAGATVVIERRTLIERENVDGTLGYAGSHTVVHRLGGNGGGRGSPQGGEGGSGGTLTWLAKGGSTVSRGGALYRVDNKPVILFYGSTPAYRSLRTGSGDGPDVRELEQNLVALGFGSGVTVDDHFSAATAAAVKRWQDSIGLRQTGAVELGRIAFLPGAQRIGARRASVGTLLSAGSQVMETSSTRRVVKVELDVAKRSLVSAGDRVVVTLPDGSTVRGRISRIGRVAHKQDSGGGDQGGGGSDGETSSMVDMSVVLSSSRGLSRLDQAPVTVGIAQETKRRVLSVPVSALLARSGGGYAVEIAGGGRRRVVPVRVGLFANGYVEISGRGLRAGQRVGVPSQ